MSSGPSSKNRSLSLPKKNLGGVSGFNNRAVTGDDLAKDRGSRRSIDPHVLESIKSQIPLMKALIEHHRIEATARKHDLHVRCEQPDDKLIDDGHCIVGCKRTNREPFLASPQDRLKTYEYRFNIHQTLKGLPDLVLLRLVDGHCDKKKTYSVVHSCSDLSQGVICLKNAEEMPAEAVLIESKYIPTKPIENALKAIVTDMLNGDIGEHGAISDYLAHEPPRIRGHQGGWLIGSGQSPVDAAIDAVVGLEESALVIQGPPGCGKTYTAARIIAELVNQGQRVGVTSNSHAAIHNLLVAALDVCEEKEIDVTCITTNNADGQADSRLEFESNSGLAHLVDKGVVAGTTAWGFVRSDMIDSLDVLIVDEASQVSLANLVAMSRCARNLLVLGDQRQLGQPIAGRHKDGGDLSALDFRLRGMPTVRPDVGILLATSYRLHPSICRVVSDHVYVGRLDANSGNAVREMEVPSQPIKPWHVPAGIVYVPVEHQGNRHFSPEEVDVAAQVRDDLVGRYWRDSCHGRRKLSEKDILFVTPFNAQVTRLKASLGGVARVGTVDKFQGQEAPVVVVSLCLSGEKAKEAGLSFVLNMQRMNVAVSRAQTLCVLLCHPDLVKQPLVSVGSQADFGQAQRAAFFRALCDGVKPHTAKGGKVAQRNFQSRGAG